MEKLFSVESVESGKVTIKDIAKIANVSATAVSNALSGKPNISAKMRELIMQTAEELGYTPNLTARSLNRSNIRIALILPGNPTEISQQYINGMKKAIKSYSGAKLECDIITYATTDDHARHALLHIAENPYDGIIISFPNIHEYKHKDIFKKINEKNIPVISIVDALSELNTCANVMVDAKTGGALAADIIGNCIGDESCAVFTAVNPLQIVHKSYIEGFKEELKFYNTKISEIFYSTDVNNTAYARAKDCFSQKNPPKAAFATCYNAFEICNALKELGLDRSIKVVGVDTTDENYTCLSNGSLTATIYQRQDEQIRRAFLTLIDCILTNNTERRENILVTPNIITKSRAGHK